MARVFLICSAFVLACLLVPPVSARPGSRSCHGSFFFRDLSSNDLRTLTLISDGDETQSGPSVFSIAAAKISSSGSRMFSRIDYRRPLNIVKVRVSNLHRQKLENPNLSYTLDLPTVWKEDFMVDVSSFSENLPQKQIVHSWSFSTSDRHPIPLAGAHPRHGRDFADRGQQHPHPEGRHDDSWHLSMHDVWRITFGLLFGAVCGASAAVAMTLAWSLFRRICLSSHEDGDVGILYGYQELPSPKSNEKLEANSYQKVSTKETTGKMENI